MRFVHDVVFVRRFAIIGLACVGLLARAADAPSGLLRLTVVDAATAAPTSCTVTIIDSAGKTIVDNRSFTAGFRCDGHFEKRLPAGKTRIRLTRGFEIRAVDQVVEVPADGGLDLKLALERVVHLRARGWYAGDSHAHMLHGERTIPVDFDFVALTARAEDLQLLSLAQAWTLDNPSPERLAAELKSRSTPDCLLTWNLEAPKNYYRGDAGRCLGHSWTLGMNGRTPDGASAIELLLQASAHDYESDKPTYANFESHQLIHALGGSVFYTHPARWWTGPWGGQGGYPKREQMRVSNLAVELPLDTLLGPTYDGVDLLTGAGEFAANAMAFDLWCLLLNHGYRVAGTASSDACFDRPGGATPGVVRTYTYLDGPFSLSKVAKAAAQGRNFVTSGPLLLANVEGQPPGSSFPADGTSRALQIEAWASGVDLKGLTRLELLRNGKVVETLRFSPEILSLKTNLSITEAETAWYCVRLFGSDPQRQRANSGAFFFDAKPHQPPAPLSSRVHVTLQDAATGKVLNGSVTEISFHGPLPRPGRTHTLPRGEAQLTVLASMRLRAQAPGYEPQTLSLFLDNPPLVDFVTNLSAEDLLNWDTFEKVRSLLHDMHLTFHLQPEQR